VVTEAEVARILADHFWIVDTPQHRSGWAYDPDLHSVDVWGDCRLSRNLERLPLRFGRIYGDFNCGGRGLKTLANAPHTVDGSFRAHENQLFDLMGGPKKVGGDYWCGSNRLESLKGCPRQIKGNFWAPENQNLHSLKNGPQQVHGELAVSGCNLTSLKGLPAQMGAVMIDYDPHMPLLSLLNAKEIALESKVGADYTDATVAQVAAILNRYAGQGEAGAFECGAELATAGFKENARW